MAEDVGTQLDQALYTVLSGASSITDHLADGVDSVVSEVGKQNADLPLVVFSEQADNTVWGLTEIKYHNMLYDVRAIVEGESMALAGTIDAAIAGVLNDSGTSVSGFGLLYARRESGIRFAEVSEGIRHNHRGGMYRIWLAPV